MLRIYRRAVDIVQKEGISALLPMIYNKAVFDARSICSSLYYAMRMRMTRVGSDVPSLIDFAFTGCGGFIKPAQIPEEIGEFISIVAAMKPRAVIEIGTASGGTLFLLTKVSAEDAVIISIDLFGGKFGGGYYAWKTPLYRSFILPKQKIHLLRGNSHEPGIVRKVEDMLLKRRADVVFIDGDHSYEGVKRDFELYKPLVRKGGVIAFHDIALHPKETGCAVHSFWAEVKKDYRYKEIVADKDQTGCGIGVLYVD